jgi:sarcosine/dimethylglycine N-methyltransferase
MVRVQELYELWAGDSELRDALTRSLEPRGTDWLFERFAALGPRPGDRLLDAGARDAVHAIRLAQAHDLHAVALDPVPLHCDLARQRIAESGLDIDVVEGRLEELPFEDASFDWIWCRDVLGHVDVSRALAECARVLRPTGAILAYVTLATDRLEPRERAELVDAAAVRTFDAEDVEHAADAAGLTAHSVERLGSEWHERMLEDAAWSANDDLLAIARLARGDLPERYGETAAAAARGGLLWGIYQLLGKLCPTVYVWKRST